MEANHIYLIRGASTACSPFFESVEHCRLFLRLADRFLSDYLRITSFQNNRDGWAMIIATRSADEIKRAYLARRACSQKCKKEYEFSEVWQMLSDQIRILLSTYVRTTNFSTGRTGAKVRRRYERYVFESEEEALAARKSLESEYYKLRQPSKRYRPRKKSHKMRKKLLRKSVYASSRLLAIPAKLRELGLGCVDIGVFIVDCVARQLVTRTLRDHFST